ncbi:pyruvate, phosphate dikinase [Peredibacter starrii]|uniref:Pyruvate, phosphate dikinase n=1 Tax=Peredibacter starrii TaxID=28202 RepID=A0AAX4HNQ0_9BACT|nr:pyruvate, phosphate dikinase [Peredibacter starrii]WPU64945.1 pyruvate, phosphate dikinase [Peredibacter starrii]
MKQWVYKFSAEQTDGNKDMKALLGGKGANLAEMCSMKLSVPPGFTVSTEACLDFYKTNKEISKEIKDQVLESLSWVEKLTGKKFGDVENPLLFSVRSGARASMPGMMDTVLNLGLNDKTVQGIAKKTGNPRFAWDSYRRFIQMFSNVVLGVNTSHLESNLEDLKEARGVHEDTALTAADLEELVKVYKSVLLEDHGIVFPQDPMEQLWRSIGAVFGSWNNNRAMKYREMNNIPHDWGTAVNVQSMVFGNMGDTCATGVCFTRDPSTGEKKFFGEFLVNAQGEDVVAGIRTPQPINNDSKMESNKHHKTLEEVMPKAYADLVEDYKMLERHYKDMQDIEFTIENGKLWILQTRNAKRTVNAALKVAVDLVAEGMITEKEAILRISPEDLNQLLHPRLDPKAKKTLIATGLPASPGAASGQMVFTSAHAEEWHKAGKKVVLVRAETSPEDIGGMVASTGILTARGGMTSHAAVVARGMGKPCVAGCTALVINEKEKTLTVKGKVYKEGDYITFDGANGEVYEGVVPTIEASITADFATFMKWADGVRRLKVRTNADTPEDTKTAIQFGAQGIGLCRTEHMFFAPERILAVREMIFAENEKDRKKALDKLLPFQRSDFAGIFKELNGLPANIRLLDPPLHEFLPHSDKDQEELASALGINVKAVKERNDALHEFNPMLGHRGCRLAVTYPEIYLMQVRAIIEAAIDADKAGIKVLPEIMIPLITEVREYSMIKDECKAEIERVFKEKNHTVKYKMGTMLELPRACIMAGEIAKEVEFFSFGTNDLTQTTFGLSRDDAGKFLPSYTQKGIYPRDPFVSIDQDGVGFLMKHAVSEGKKTNAAVYAGICGEHGGEPQSVEFCHKIGLEYVSCSPFRVPIARLAAAQAALRN